ncbi:gag-pol polyprotein [Cucumis melo var. makuwa]|uniref:Gag-pol polyprotein n=1 Tax=Cucumis melo var. makuwa TaxID=1194695 RepID=A0A5D3BTE9_CUCMM|nr:gag-pol polyprotein [Cucumis melo var. makuwa]
MLTNETKKLDHLIGQGKRCDDKRGLGFAGRKGTGNKTTVFVRECDTQNSQAENANGKYTKDAVSPLKSLNRRKICYFYGKSGNFRLQSLMYRQHALSQSIYLKRRRTKWCPKTNSKDCEVALISVNNSNSTYWYFDSGCSRHMIGNAAFFLELSECNARSVLFGDGGKGRIIGKGTIDHPRLPYLLDVRLVQGLSVNLNSISQLCDQGYQVSFSKDRWNVAEEVSLWHKRLGHINGTSIAKVVNVDAIIGLPTLSFNPQECCPDCPAGKQVKSSHKSTSLPFTLCTLELLHIDLMGPMQTESLGGKREKNTGICRIRSDHGREFENKYFTEFCENEGIFLEFLAPLTPQQNGVVERKNRTLQEMARVMIHAKHLPNYFWAEALNTACHIHNRVTLRLGTITTSYELWKGRKSNVKYFLIFGNTYFIFSDKDHHRKWDSKSDRGIFLGYSTSSRAYIVYNQRTRTGMKFVNVIIDDHGKSLKKEALMKKIEIYGLPTPRKLKIQVSHSDACASEASVSACQQTNEYTTKLPNTTDTAGLSIGITTRMKERRDYAKMVANVCYTSTMEPTNVTAALTDEHWILAMGGTTAV